MTDQYLVIQINGKPFCCESSMSIEELLSYLNISIELNLIEYNREILSSSQLHHTFIKSNDQLEIITVVGGG
uniref:Thiamin biosynthesis protein S n=1 Tax=Scinaia undulata TaxID=1884664 RepID=A0A1G4NXV2_9FLOR|nr:Thiamin biosynthesis protein S [Scinaia undulata]SCW23482.1 Thiamin biosynthesis protein S [Scinaia undulata]